MTKNNKIRLDIGSGRAKFEDYITVDNDPSVGADICVDIESIKIEQLHGLPVVDFNNDGSMLMADYFAKVDEIRAHHILEHLKPENKVKVMALFWDLLKDGGVLDIEVPLFPHPASVQDPTHLSFWNVESFWYFIRENKFGEGFAKRYSQLSVPLFEKVEDWYKGNEGNRWAYGIRLCKKE